MGDCISQKNNYNDREKEIQSIKWEKKGKQMDYRYTISEWLLFFFLYCFAGWCIESTYVSIHQHKLVNRGFMRGPFLPLYGSGAVMALFITIPFRDSIPEMFVVGAIGATILEYFTGVIMEAIFKVRYWDYSDKKFNLNGHICLGTSIAWGFLTIALVKFIHAPVEQFVLRIPEKVQAGIAMVLTVIMAGDFALSFKAALDIRDILVKMEKAKEELERVQTRLDAMIAFLYPREEQKEKTSKRQQISEILQDIKKKFDLLQTDFEQEDSKAKENLVQSKKELIQLREKYIIAREQRISLRERLGFYKRSILKSHPSINSTKFKDALSELKTLSEDKKDKKKENHN